MALSKKPYKGTRDLFPPQKRGQNHLFDTMRTTAQRMGYEPYDGPLLEEVALYQAKSGEELIRDQIYSFTDRGDRLVAIRPEMTPTLARMVMNYHREESKPIRLFSIPNLMRYEKPQKGRLREHWQFNCDIFGAPPMMGEVEILQIAINLLTSLGATAKQFEILINHREVVSAIFSQLMELDDTKVHALYKIVDRAKKVSREDLNKMITTLQIGDRAELILTDYLQLASFDQLIIFLNQNKLKEQAAEITLLVELTTKLKIDHYLRFDPTIVRGLDYYTGVVFEIFDKNPENPRAICGGGAYQNLLTIFGGPVMPAVGFGLGDVTLTDFLTTHGLMPDFTNPQTDLFISAQHSDAQIEALKLASLLRQEGISVVTQLEPIKIKKAFPLAQKRGARFIALIGEQELDSGSVQFKNMTTREQSTLHNNQIEDIINLIKT
jgi:histidyl-tRNA synthetase